MAFTDDIPDDILDGILELSRAESPPPSVEELQEAQETEINEAMLFSTEKTGEDDGEFRIEPYLNEDRGTLASK